jgi:DNA excision repair protein ERCC-2
MRHAAQCLGRVLRGKDDYGIMVLADRRFLKKRNQLPKWINQALLDSEVNLSTDMAVGSAKKFLKSMAQPFKSKDQEGISTWSLADVERFKERQEEEVIRALRDTQMPEHGMVEGNERMITENEHGFDDDELEAEMMQLDGA